VLRTVDVTRALSSVFATTYRAVILRPAILRARTTTSKSHRRTNQTVILRACDFFEYWRKSTLQTQGLTASKSPKIKKSHKL
jgi:hypothetical protein